MSLSSAGPAVGSDQDRRAPRRHWQAARPRRRWRGPGVPGGLGDGLGDGRGRRARSYYKHGVFYIPGHWRGPDEEPRRAVPWTSLLCRRPRRRPRRRRRPARGCRGSRRARAPERNCLAFLAKFLRLKLRRAWRQRLSGADALPTGSPMPPARAAAAALVPVLLHKACQTRPPRARRSDWKSLEAAVRVVLGHTLDGLVQQIAALFIAHKKDAALAASPSPLARVPANPPVRAPAKAAVEGRARVRAARDATKSEMVLSSAVKASDTAAPGKSRSAPAATRTRSCKCMDSRSLLQRPPPLWGSSGDSSDVKPATVIRDTSQTRPGTVQGSTPVERPTPWHCCRAEEPRASAPVTPLSSPRCVASRLVSPSRGGGGGPRDRRRPEGSADAVAADAAQVSVQVLYEPAVADRSPSPAPGGPAQDDGGRGPGRRPPHPRAGACCRAMVSHVQGLQAIITALQHQINHLGLEASQRDAEADRWRQSVEFWQKRYEALKNEHSHCPVNGPGCTGAKTKNAVPKRR